MTDEDNMEETSEPVEEDPPVEVENLHPIVLLLAEKVEASEDGKFLPLSEELLEDLAEGVLEYVDDEDPKVELLHIAQSLTAYANTLRTDHEAGDLADQILMVVTQEAVINNLHKLSVSSDPEKVREIASNFGEFTGDKKELKAPKVGEAKPEGSVDLNALNFPKRL